MRVLIAVLALVATPVIASVAQAQGSTPPASVRQNCANDHRWQEGNHLGDKNASKQGCDPSGGTGGSGVGTVSGLVFIDFFGTGVWSSVDPGIAGWAIQLTGAVTLATSSDMLGNYSFTGVPAGSYTLCQVQPTTWRQTLPSSGCYSIAVVAGGVVSGQDFGLVMQ